jgi:hypothetical protein
VICGTSPNGDAICPCLMMLQWSPQLTGPQGIKKKTLTLKKEHVFKDYKIWRKHPPIKKSKPTEKGGSRWNIDIVGIKSITSYN